MYVVHRNTHLDSFRIRIVWFQPKQDSDRIRISVFKNRIGSDSENPLSNRLWCYLHRRDEHGSGLDQDWSQFWPDQDWIGFQFFWKLADQDWIGLRKFLLFRCDYSEHIKNVSCDPILQICSWQCRIYFSINGKSSAATVLQFEVYPPLPTYNVEFW